MGSIEDQIREARDQRTGRKPTPNSTEDAKDGIQFGTSVAFDDAYGSGGGNSGGGEYVSSLPTLDEERRMMMDDDDNDAGRLAEREDTGRVGSHPSTLASTKVCTKFFVIDIFYMLYVLRCSYLLTDFFFPPVYFT
jgi:hypothetical protein